MGVENKNQSDAGQEIQENMDSGPERNKLLSRFLVLASEQNVDDLRLKWLEATAPPVAPPPEPAKPKLSAEDWERIKNGHEKTKMNLKALKERTGKELNISTLDFSSKIYFSTKLLADQRGKDLLIIGKYKLCYRGSENPAQVRKCFG